MQCCYIAINVFNILETDILWMLNEKFIKALAAVMDLLCGRQNYLSKACKITILLLLYILNCVLHNKCCAFQILYSKIAYMRQ